jgi:hypothetical protein
MLPGTILMVSKTPLTQKEILLSFRREYAMFGERYGLEWRAEGNHLKWLRVVPGTADPQPKGWGE